LALPETRDWAEDGEEDAKLDEETLIVGALDATGVGPVDEIV